MTAAANADRELVVYDENGGTFTVDLSEMKGELKARWYDPREGEFRGSESLEGGQAKQFGSPKTGENWALQIYRRE